jgi:hypothetical protein
MVPDNFKNIDWRLLASGIGTLVGIIQARKGDKRANELAQNVMVAQNPRDIDGLMSWARYRPAGEKPMLDKKGNIIYKRDDDGKLLKDKDGKRIALLRGEGYEMGLQPPFDGMMGNLAERNTQYDEAIDPYMNENGMNAMATQRYEQNLEAIQPRLMDSSNQMLRNLHERGMLGSSIGARIIAEKARSDNMQRAQLMEQARGGTQAELTNLLNRQNMARRDYLSLAQSARGIGAMGLGQGAQAGSLAASQNPMLMNSYNQSQGALTDIGRNILGAVEPAKDII